MSRIQHLLSFRTSYLGGLACAFLLVLHCGCETRPTSSPESLAPASRDEKTGPSMSPTIDENTIRHEVLTSLGSDRSLLVLPNTGSSLTPQDCDAINHHKDCPSVQIAVPLIERRGQITFDNKKRTPAYIYGTTPEFLTVRDWNDLPDGECFNDQDLLGAREVCVVGETVARALFGDEPARGRYVRLNNTPMVVLGVLSHKGVNKLGEDQDDIVLLPWTTLLYKIPKVAKEKPAEPKGSTTVTENIDQLKNLYPATGDTDLPGPEPIRVTTVDRILILVNQDKEMKTASKEITEVLRPRHKLRADQPDNFTIRDLTEEFVKALKSGRK